MLNDAAVRFTLVHLRDADNATTLQLDVLKNGRVQIRVPQQKQILYADTIEDLMLYAAASNLQNDLYDSLIWELELLASRGDSIAPD